ncbi:MAG: PASTA domain-containing protein [Clostridiales Family XIII bacterium]|jgi:hypothetical protein|nr:PASTA domain-containing protein [Clostridiales Family XIII bacterium]
MADVTPTALPDLTGFRLADAEAVLGSLGLRWTAVETKPPFGPAPRLRTSPPGGTAGAAPEGPSQEPTGEAGERRRGKTWDGELRVIRARFDGALNCVELLVCVA